MYDILHAWSIDVCQDMLHGMLLLNGFKWFLLTNAATGVDENLCSRTVLRTIWLSKRAGTSSWVSFGCVK
jgi:hypothetical protein